MSIKPIEQVPEDARWKKPSQRDMIREDIQTAFEKRITPFEIEGDYNYRYLKQYVREELNRWWRRISRPIERRVAKELQEEWNVKYVFPPSAYEYQDEVCTVHNRKEKDRNHVYVEIRYDFIDSYYQTLRNDTIRQYEARKREDEDG